MREGYLPTGAVSFLMTDVVGSTSLWERDRHRMAEAVARHDQIADRIASEYLGFKLKERGEGDSCFFVFDQAANAVEAGLAFQTLLASEAPELTLRMAVHAGEASPRDFDYFGPTVNRCARLKAAGHGGQLLISEAIRQLVIDVLPPNLELFDLGIHRLKDLSREERVWQVGRRGEFVEFPRLASLPNYPNNLPVQLTSFVGRQRDVDRIGEYLKSKPLVTIAGTGGAGKTRLALQVAGEALEKYPGGVCFCELASARTEEDVTRLIAKDLGVSLETPDDSHTAIISALGQRKMLLILDNCEQVVEAVASLVDACLIARVNATFLLTSRTPVLPGLEQEVRLTSLTLPPINPSNIEEVIASEAVQLLVDRAHLFTQSFAVDEENCDALASIVRRLEGLPLGIELAAPRLRTLPPIELSERLAKDLKLLEKRDLRGPERHLSVEKAVEWSYGLLTDEEKILLARLAVFRGGWTLRMAEFVCEDERAPDVLALVESLSSKSFLIMDEQERGGVRQRLLVPVWEFASKRLAEDPAPFRRLLEWCLQLAAETENELAGAEFQISVSRLDAELPNISAAYEYAVAEDPVQAVRLISGLHRYWIRGKQHSLGRKWLVDALAIADAPEDLTAISKNLIGALSMVINDTDSAAHWLSEALQDFQRLDMPARIAAASNNLALVEISRGNTDEAIAKFKTCIETYRALGNKQGLLHALGNLGILSLDTSPTDALPILKEAHQIAIELKDRWYASHLRCKEAVALYRSASKPEASECLADAVNETEGADLRGLAIALEACTEFAVGADDLEAAARMAGTLKRFQEEFKLEESPENQALIAETIATVTKQLGKPMALIHLAEWGLFSPVQILEELRKWVEAASIN